MLFRSPVSAIVYACSGSDVTHTWVDGALQYADSTHVSINREALMQTVRGWQQRIASSDRQEDSP